VTSNPRKTSTRIRMSLGVGIVTRVKLRDEPITTPKARAFLVFMFFNPPLWFVGKQET
jgi:hypothetical protein